MLSAGPPQDHSAVDTAVCAAGGAVQTAAVTERAPSTACFGRVSVSKQDWQSGSSKLIFTGSNYKI